MDHGWVGWGQGFRWSPEQGRSTFANDAQLDRAALVGAPAERTRVPNLAWQLELRSGRRDPRWGDWPMRILGSLLGGELPEHVERRCCPLRTAADCRMYSSRPNSVSLSTTTSSIFAVAVAGGGFCGEAVCLGGRLGEAWPLDSFRMLTCLYAITGPAPRQVWYTAGMTPVAGWESLAGWHAAVSCRRARGLSDVQGPVADDGWSDCFLGDSAVGCADGG